jgi:predicted phosphodiesterase
MISWESDKSMCAPEVTYWTSSGDKKNTAGTSAKMQTSGCGLPLPAPEGYENTVSISGLKSATLYNFTINQTAESGHFTTAPDNNTTEFIFAAVGDTRTGDEEHEDVIAQMVTKNPLFYVHDGDLVSAGISLDEWKTFFDIEKPLMKNSVIFPALGNHEIGGECYFTEYFHLPEGNSSYPTNYSFSFGSTAFVVLDTNQSIVTDPLFSWIEEELKKLSGHPYLFVLMHAPIYTFSKHSPYKDGKKILHPLFLKYGVRAVFAGHNHCYEHFKVDGINYFTIGSAGAPLYDADDNVIDYEKQKYWITAGSFYHYALFSVSDNKITGKIFKVDGSKETLFETVTIYPD